MLPPYGFRGVWALTDLAGVPVRAEPHRTFNSCSDLKGLTKDEIVDGLRSQGVTDCFHITVRSDNNNTERRKKQTHLSLHLILIQLRLTSMLDTFALRWIDIYRYIHSDVSNAKSLAIVPDCVEMRQSAIAVAKNIQRRTATMLPNV